MKAQTLTIVIPVFNEQEHLQNCLESIATQTIMPSEVIVVDNNSTDASVDIARRYDFVRVVTAKRQGIAHARNAGFNAVKTDLIGRIDADTILPDTWVERVLQNYAVSQDFALTGGGFFYNVPAPRINGWALGQLAYRLNRIILGHYIVWGSNMVLPTKLWRTIRADVCSDNDAIHEDLDIAIHLHERRFTIMYKEDLRVGVEMKRVYNTDENIHKKRMQMWPNTLEDHGIARAWIGHVGAWILYQGRYVVRLSNAVATAHRISRQKLETIATRAR
jgi:glycosyltransferase involved in cell wall biosynthesis